MRFPPLAGIPNLVVALVAVVGAGALCVAYGVFIERRWYRRRVYRLPVLPEGAHPLTILHVSDLHLLPSNRSLVSFLASLPPADVAVATGDLVGGPEAVEAAAAALRPIRGRLASYVVLGSNDYYAPQPLNYARYFLRERKPRKAIRGRADDLVRLLERDGWQHLRNRKASLASDGVRFEVVGLDDPHIGRQDLRVAARSDEGAVGLAIVHSPDPAPELAALGYELIVAGHTHGGQVRLPVVGALVTNGQLPTRIAMGLSSIPPALMHVSPGLGTSRYAPFRFLCRPEATILELRARPSAEAAHA
jgi:hypothetical protein